MPYKILLLEDDVLFAETIEDFLDEEGFEVDIAADAKEALEKCYHKKYDISFYSYLSFVNITFFAGLLNSPTTNLFAPATLKESIVSLDVVEMNTSGSALVVSNCLVSVPFQYLTT